jgi:hypothetical protein
MKIKLFFLQFLLFLFLANLENARGNDLKGLMYIYPEPASQMVLPETNIIFRLQDQTSVSISTIKGLLSVKGSISGVYSGELLLSDDGKTYIFHPEKPFVAGEVVEVSFNFESFSSIHYTYSFQVCKAEQDSGVLKRKSADDITSQKLFNPERVRLNSGADGDTPVVLNGVAVPNDFPFFSSPIQGNTAPGYIFIDNWGGNPYNVIFKNDGTPFYYKRNKEQSRDFKVQYPGILSRRVTEDIGGFVSMDINYNNVDTFRCQNGYGTDEHELQLLENGHSLMIGLDYKTVDMSKLVAGGNKAATVIGNSVQELDQNHNLIFLWTSWDNYNITDAIGIDLKQATIDYVHMNSIAVDYDSNLVVSSRHLSECTKINRKTGHVMWRLGGKRNQFTFVNDPDQNSYQHDIRPVPGMPNHYTLFDDGNYHTPNYSRAVEYVIDTVAMTATNVWEYRHQPDRYTWWMGNAQRLPNGNTFINYGDASLPKATEVTPDGTVVYDGDFVSPANCYRAFRFEWNGMLKHPYLVVEPYSHYIRLIFNKFGDSTVIEYKIYAGLTSEPTDLKATTTNTWFHLTNLQNFSTYYFRVTAVDNLGNESEYSNTESAYVKFIQPGINIILNGNFSSGTSNWKLAVASDAAANGLIDNLKQYKINISSGGANYNSIELTQKNIGLAKGVKYRFEFDAYADASKVIEPKIIRTSSPWTNYSQIGPILVNKVKKHYRYDFTMNSFTDNNAQVAFDCGGSAGSVYLDNVSLIEMVADTSSPKAYITNPVAYSLVKIIDTITLETTTLYFGEKIDSVVFFANNASVGKAISQPFQVLYNSQTDGDCSIFSKVYTAVGNIVISDTITFSISGYTIPVKPFNTNLGLNYLYYQGGWDFMPDFKNLNPLDSGYVTTISLSKRKQEVNYAFQFDGYIKISTKGKYNFYLNSDDGSKLYINNVKIIDNDATHSPVEISNSILLREGYYKIAVNFFQKEGGQVCELRYDGPGISKRIVPGNVLFRDNQFTPTTAAIISPPNNSTYFSGDRVHFEASVNGSPSVIKSVDFYVSDIPVGSTSSLIPYTNDWIVNTSSGTKPVYAKVILNNGQTILSPEIFLTLISFPDGTGKNIVPDLNRLYPNPTNGNINLSYFSDSGSKGLLIITDVCGREILSKDLSIQAGNNLYSIDISSLKEGLYLGYISVGNLKWSAIGKFIKQSIK